MNAYRTAMCIGVVIATLALGLSAKERAGGSNVQAGRGDNSASMSVRSGNSTSESPDTSPRTRNSDALAATLLAKEKSLPEAEKRKDADFFRSITTPDFLAVALDGKVYTRDEMLTGINEVTLQDFNMYDAQVLPLNESAAVVTYNAIVRMNVGAEELPRYQHLSSVWVKQGNDWKLKFQQATATQ